MADPTKATYLVLDGLGPAGPLAGWSAGTLDHLEAARGSLRLAKLPSPPIPLKDATGAFGGLENPTGVAVAPGGDIYVSDSATNRIFRIRRRDQEITYARFYRVSAPGFEDNRFVYVPSANRLERWPSSTAEPASSADLEIISTKAWNQAKARKDLLCYLGVSDPASITKDEDAPYPATLPIGCICQTSVEYVSCLGGEGGEPRRFRNPHGLAISVADTLYVADSGNHRVQIFQLPSLALKRIWGRRDGKPGTRPGEFNEPSDVAVDLSNNVWIADKGNARLQKYDCGQRRFQLIDGRAVAAHFFEVNYGPDARQQFVYLPLRSRLEQWLTPSPAGTGDIRVLATGIVSVSDARQRLLTELHARGAQHLFLERDIVYPSVLESGEAMLEPSDLAVDRQGRIYVIDRQKDYVRILDPAGRLLRQVLYRTDLDADFEPTAIAIDAEGKLLLASATGIHRYLVSDQPVYDRCSADWTGRCGGMSVDDQGRIFAAGPTGVSQLAPSPGFEKTGNYLSTSLDSGIDRCAWDKIVISYATDIPNSTSIEVSTFTSNEWVAPADIAALEEDQWLTRQTNASDFLVLSGPGRYLWLRIRFVGDGVSTPEIQRLRTLFPRLGYLQYLPAVYQYDATSRDLLDRFLRLFQSIFESFEFKIDHFSDFLNADGTPAAFLSWLAGWIAMTFDRSWTEEVRRRLLRNAPELYRRRGTPAGLKMFLKLAFGINAQVLEHFQLRHWTFLGNRAALGSRTQLWGRCITARMQLDGGSRIGQSAISGVSDPLHDPFLVYAHKFTIFVPASALASQAVEAAVRALVESEKPAYTQYTLAVVQPRLRLGVQSTLGLDFVIGAHSRLGLNENANLGFDSLLGCPADEKNLPLAVGRRSRVGVDSVVG
jgi:phage tail-like protein